MTFGERVQQLRWERDWSQNKLASKIGIDQTNIGKYENDGRLPTLPIFKKLCTAFELSTDEFLKGVEFEE